ncbi:hypothetical protein V6N13_052912 [Hibiscus sabdariffa]
MVEPSPTTPVDLLRDSAKEQEELEWTNRKEAHLSLEVGETVGFRFNEERPVVIRSLESLENDAERGFGKAEKRHAIKNLVKKFRINFLFIQETKLEIVEAKIAKFIGGDFNLVRGQEEKIGFSFNASSSEALNDFIDETGLFDLPLFSSRFTWSNARDHGTFCRLDRVLVSPELLHILPGSSIQELRGSRIGNILEYSKRVTKAWVEKERKISTRALIEEAEKKIAALEALIQSGKGNGSIREELKATKSKLWGLLRTEEREWRQKSQVQWILRGT